MNDSLCPLQTPSRSDQSLHMDLWMIVCLAAVFSALEQFPCLL